MEKLVTIDIPTLRRLAYLKESVQSALSQDYPLVEVLISDDGEDADLRQWCESLERHDHRVRYWHNPRRLGLAGNWNELAANTRGEYLVIIGDDDRLLPNFVSNLVPILNEGVDVAFSNHYLIDHTGKRLEKESLRYTNQFHRNNLCRGNLEKPEIQVWENSIPMSSSLIRTSVVRRLRFNESLNTPEIEFFLRLAQENGRFYFAPEYLAEYRVHVNSATSSGLWSDKLIEALMPITASPDIEPYKKRFISGLLFNGINRCLMEGDWDRMRAFSKNPYMQNGHGSPKQLLQKACSGLPKSIGWPLYRAAHKLWKRSVKA